MVDDATISAAGELEQFGPYRLQHLLGEGAFGQVWMATDGAGRQLALKVLRAQVVADVDAARRFEREAKLGMRLSHPNVVRILDAGRIDGRLYMASELVPGGSVSGLIEERGPQPIARACAIAADLLRGLQALADQGLIHRDVKPANLLLDGDGVAKLSDLGLARSTSIERTRFTADGAIVGSPAYIAPEFISGESEGDIRCDLYAAGIVLFELLTARTPFGEGTVVEILSRHLEQAPPKLRSLRPDAPAALEALVDDLLRKKPSQRPVTPAAALARLAPWLPAGAAAPVPVTIVDGPAAAFPGTIALPAAEAFPATITEGTAFPSTMPEGGAFPSTLPQGGAFPSTLPQGGAFPSTLPQGGAFPSTMPERGGGAFPRTLADGAAFPATVDQRAPVPSTLPGGPTVPGGPARPASVPAGMGARPTRDDATLPTVLAAVTLTPTGAPGLDRALLRIASGGTTRLLFVYAGTRLVAGRDGIEREGQDLCLRLFPAAAMAESSKRLSGRHVAFAIAGSRATCEDLGSSGGTSVRGERVPAGVPQVIAGSADVRLADTLELRLRLLMCGAPAAVDGHGEAGREPALLIERLRNAPERAYLLLSSSVALDASGAPSSRGAAQLIAAGGRLWWRLGDEPHARPLRAGDAIALGAATATVAAIAAADHK